MLKSINGFALIETIIIFNLLLIISLFIVPLYVSLKQEKAILHDRAIIVMKLHDELQKYIYERELLKDTNYNLNVHHRAVNFYFTSENEYIKGCATWKNMKQREEQYCLYGMVEK